MSLTSLFQCFKADRKDGELAQRGSVDKGKNVMEQIQKPSPPMFTISNASVHSLQSSNAHKTSSLTCTTTALSQSNASIKNTPTEPLVAPIPSPALLKKNQSNINALTSIGRIAWCRDVLFLTQRPKQTARLTKHSWMGVIAFTDVQIYDLLSIAVPLIVKIASEIQMPMPRHVAEAIYMRGLLSSNRSFQAFINHDLDNALRDFTVAANGGFQPAWFYLGLQLENEGDIARAKASFGNGVKLGVASCIHRIGIAHLMGQLGLTARPEIAITFFHHAASLATVEVPYPAYVWALILLREFPEYDFSPEMYAPFIPSFSDALLEARKYIERAAYLHFAPAQYKLGYAYQTAVPPFHLNPLRSVEYYKLASDQGDHRASMALSEWFLRGSGSNSDGVPDFERDEYLARTYAERAAMKGFPKAEFALGYYAELGIGGPVNNGEALDWYHKASEHGVPDAAIRIADLTTSPVDSLLSADRHSLPTIQFVDKIISQHPFQRSITNPSQSKKPRDVGRIRASSVTKPERPFMPDSSIPPIPLPQHAANGMARTPAAHGRYRAASVGEVPQVRMPQALNPTPGPVPQRPVKSVARPRPASVHSPQQTSIASHLWTRKSFEGPAVTPVLVVTQHNATQIDTLRPYSALLSSSNFTGPPREIDTLRPTTASISSSESAAPPQDLLLTFPPAAHIRPISAFKNPHPLLPPESEHSPSRKEFAPQTSVAYRVASEDKRRQPVSMPGSTSIPVTQYTRAPLAPTSRYHSTSGEHRRPMSVGGATHTQADLYTRRVAGRSFDGSQVSRSISHTDLYQSSFDGIAQNASMRPSRSVVDLVNEMRDTQPRRLVRPLVIQNDQLRHQPTSAIHEYSSPLKLSTIPLHSYSTQEAREPHTRTPRPQTTFEEMGIPYKSVDGEGCVII